jgi:Mce-associated membrane protein
MTALTTRGLVAAIGVTCLPVIGAGVTFVARSPSDAGTGALTDAGSQQALTSARSAVAAILSYDYRSIGSDIAAAKADTTGRFAQQYAGTAPQLLSEATQVKAIVQATVGSTGVVSATPTDVVVLAFVDQATVRETPGKKTPTTRIDQSRVEVTMTKVGTRWLVSSLSAL